jgi:hypothetical protein
MSCNPIFFIGCQRAFEIIRIGIDKNFDRLSEIRGNKTPDGLEPCLRSFERLLPKISVAFIPVNFQHSRLQGLPVKAVASLSRD